MDRQLKHLSAQDQSLQQLMTNSPQAMQVEAGNKLVASVVDFCESDKENFDPNWKPAPSVSSLSKVESLKSSSPLKSGQLTFGSHPHVRSVLGVRQMR